MKVSITVIIPVYNTENTLDRCIKSVIANHIDEVILVDDGSLDGSGKKCDNWAELDTRIKVIHKANGGLSDARNEGLKVATGNYVSFVDSDDEVALDTYAPLIDFLSEHREVQILEFPARIHIGGKDEHLLTFADSVIEIDTSEKKKELWLNDVFAHSYVCNKIFHRDLFNDISFQKGALFEDAIIMPRLIQKAQYYATCNKGMYLYYINKDGITRDFSNLPQLLQAQLQICKDSGIDITSPKADRLYLSLINTQIDICRYAHVPELYLPHRKLPLSTARNCKELLKIILLNTIGLKGLVKIFILFRNLAIVMMPAYIFHGLTF
jgi:glycosyltransferase involved in cell wall biosynthesis